MPLSRRPRHTSSGDSEGPGPAFRNIDAVLAKAARLLTLHAKDEQVALAIEEINNARQIARSFAELYHENPRSRQAGIMSHDVKAVVYRHIEDGELYVHGFNDVALELHTKRDGTLVIGGLAPDDTNVEMRAMPDGSVWLRGMRGQSLWEDC